LSKDRVISITGDDQSDATERTLPAASTPGRTEKEAETAPSLFFRRVLGALGRSLMGALRFTESL